VRFEEVAPAPGADAVVDCLAQALLDPGDEIVCGWPSFPSYVLDARKLGAVPRTVALRDHRYDLDALLDAVGPRTKIVYVCYPNNPTGTMNSRTELDAYFDRVPDDIVTVVDQAYFEYVTDPDYADGVDYLKAGRRVVVLRTFSKIYGLAGLRVGYGVGPADLVTAIGKVRRAFDLSAPAQAAALASLGDEDEVARRRRLNEESRAALERSLREHGFEVAGPPVANFLYAEASGDVRALFDALLRQGVIVRPLASFGAPDAIRVTVGTPEENAFLAEALAAISLVT
jgi:histidinol-phosphate aminotransferase